MDGFKDRINNLLVRVTITTGKCIDGHDTLGLYVDGVLQCNHYTYSAALENAKRLIRKPNFIKKR